MSEGNDYIESMGYGLDDPEAIDKIIQDIHDADEDIDVEVLDGADALLDMADELSERLYDIINQIDYNYSTIALTDESINSRSEALCTIEESLMLLETALETVKDL